MPDASQAAFDSNIALAVDVAEAFDDEPEQTMSETDSYGVIP